MSCHAVGRWLFGKLPSQGDFVSRGLDHAMRERIDRWLAAEMAAARAAFADFEERYARAPAWTFVDRDDEARWGGGALCASVDRVGRHFPLVMAAPAQDAAAAVGMAGACLDALHAAFAGHWDADALHCAPLVPATLPWHPLSSEWALVGVDGPAYVASGSFPEGILTAMLDIAP